MTTKEVIKRLREEIDKIYEKYEGHPELEHDAGEMGWFPVGCDCYRKLKKELDGIV